MGPTIYFVRHGETQASQIGAYTGVLDVDMTPEVAVFSSLLRRARDTAKPLCDALGLAMQSRDGLRELSYGEWEGKTPEEVNRQFHDDYVRWLADAGWNRPTGGERGVDVARTLRITLCSLLGIDVSHYRDRLSLPVASLSVVDMTDEGPLLRSFGDRSHLRQSLRVRPGT